MKFLDDLRAYLERPEPPRPGFELDVAPHRQHLLRALDALPESEASTAQIERAHRELSPHLALYIEALAVLLVKSLGDLPREEIARLTDVAIDRRLGLSTTSGSRSLDLELDCIRRDAF